MLIIHDINIIYFENILYIMNAKKIVNMPVKQSDVDRMMKITGEHFKDSYSSMFARLLDICDKMNQAIDLDDLR